MILSNVGICGVAVRVVLMLEDAVFNVGGIGVVGGSAVVDFPKPVWCQQLSKTKCMHI